MPCTVTGSIEGDRALDAAEARETATKTTQMLCSICEMVEKRGCPSMSRMPADVKAWWVEHKKMDARNRPKPLCDKHRAYNGVGMPKAKCPTCWKAFLKKNPESVIFAFPNNRKP
jgi:hypothetical protein